MAHCHFEFFCFLLAFTGFCLVLFFFITFNILNVTRSVSNAYVHDMTQKHLLKFYYAVGFYSFFHRKYSFKVFFFACFNMVNIMATNKQVRQYWLDFLVENILCEHKAKYCINLLCFLFRFSIEFI